MAEQSMLTRTLVRQAIVFRGLSNAGAFRNGQVTR